MPYSSASDEVIAPYFKEMKKISLLTPQEEQEIGRRVKESQEALLGLALAVKTSFVPLRAFQKMLRDWRRKKKNSREPIEFIFKELDEVIHTIDELDQPAPELLDFTEEAKGLRAELNRPWVKWFRPI